MAGTPGARREASEGNRTNPFGLDLGWWHGSDVAPSPSSELGHQPVSRCAVSLLPDSTSERFRCNGRGSLYRTGEPSAMRRQGCRSNRLHCCRSGDRSGARKPGSERSRPFRAMSDREILAQKFHYRAAGFAGRDLFDFVTVTEAVPNLLDDPDLRGIAGRVRNALTWRMDTPGLRKGFDLVTRIGEAPDFDEARSRFGAWLKECGMPQPHRAEADPLAIPDPRKPLSPSD